MPRHFILGLIFCVTSLSLWPTSAIAQEGGKQVMAQMFAGNPKSFMPVSQGPYAGSMKIDAKTKRVDSAAIPIQGNQRHELVMHARLDSAFVVEQNDRAIQLTLNSFRYGRTSSYVLIFLNDHNEEISRFGYDQRGFFLTEQWHEYVMAFYTPADAAAMKVRFEPRGCATYLRDVRLKPITNEPAINLNPDFRYGELNYSGWQPQREGRLYQQPDGAVMFRSGYGASSPAFPLDDSTTYRVNAVGKGGKISMGYYDEQGKSLHIRFLIRPSDGKEQVEFQPPQGTRFGRLILYSVALKSCHIIPVTQAGK